MCSSPGRLRNLYSRAILDKENNLHTQSGDILAEARIKDNAAFLFCGAILLLANASEETRSV